MQSEIWHRKSKCREVSSIFYTINGMLNALIRIDSMRRFSWVHTTYKLMINKKSSLNVRISKGSKNEFEWVMVNDLSLSELLMFDYMFLPIVDWMNSPTLYIGRESNLNFRYVRLCDLDIPREKMVELFANSGDPDQTPRSALFAK